MSAPTTKAMTPAHSQNTERRHENLGGEEKESQSPSKTNPVVTEIPFRYLDVA
jgi:hypothetical protein